MAARKTKDYLGVVIVRNEDGTVKEKTQVTIKAKNSAEAKAQMTKQYGSQNSEDDGALAWTVGLPVSSI